MLLLSGASKEALKSGLSDMEYLRSKVAQTDDTMEENELKDDGAGGDDEDNGPVQHTDSAYESGDTSKTNTTVSSEDKKHSKAKKTAKQEVTVQTNLRVKTLLFNTPQYLLSVCCALRPTSICCRRSR